VTFIVTVSVRPAKTNFQEAVSVAFSTYDVTTVSFPIGITFTFHIPLTAEADIAGAGAGIAAVVSAGGVSLVLQAARTATHPIKAVMRIWTPWKWKIRGDPQENEFRGAKT
jgi:hypothetical protein